MMERDFIAQKTKELHIKRYLEGKLSNVGLSQIRLKKIPLGEKIIISTSRPGLIVGSKGANIKDLTRHLKKEFKLENPQIEINEIRNVFLDAQVVAEKIANSLERFGSARFKSIGHKMMEKIMEAGALGVEVVLSGKIPGARAKSWRFYQGYLKKCGDISLTGVRRAKKSAALKSGIIGIKVSIMPPDLKLPDKITLLENPPETLEKKKEEEKAPAPLPEKKKTVKKKEKTEKAPRKKKVKEEKIPAQEIQIKEEVKEEGVREEAGQKPEESPAELTSEPAPGLTAEEIIEQSKQEALEA